MERKSPETWVAEISFHFLSNMTLPKNVIKHGCDWFVSFFNYIRDMLRLPCNSFVVCVIIWVLETCCCRWWHMMKLHTLTSQPLLSEQCTAKTIGALIIFSDLGSLPALAPAVSTWFPSTSLLEAQSWVLCSNKSGWCSDQVKMGLLTLKVYYANINIPMCFLKYHQ